jgi:hypothetical protein
VLEWPIADMVRAWLRGAPYEGIELKATNEAGDDNWRVLASAEHPIATTAPKLTVLFDTNAVPSSLSSASVGNRLTAGELAGQEFTYKSLYGRTGFYKDDLDELARSGTLSEAGFPKTDWPTDGDDWIQPEGPNPDPPYTSPQPGEPWDAATSSQQPSPTTPKSSSSADPGPNDPDWVLTIILDPDKKRVYYRKGWFDGRDGFGDTKIRQKHNLNQRAVTAVVMYPDPNNGNTQQTTNLWRWNYIQTVHEVKCDGWWMFQDCKKHQTTRVQVVVDYSPKSWPKNSTTGVITAYCINQNWCPDWVKNAINI